MRLRACLAFVFSSVVVAASCKSSSMLFQGEGGAGGASSSSSGAPLVCTPGIQISCPCPGGAPGGVQVCNQDGSGYGACSCGGTGGASSSSSSSSTTSASSTSTSSSTSGGPTCAATWSKGFTDSGTVNAGAVAVDGQGHVVVAGVFTGTVSFGGSALVQQGLGYNFFVARFDCSGNHLWSKRFGAPTMNFGDLLYGLAVASDGSIVLTGTFQGPLDFGTGPLTQLGSSDGFIAKLDAAGNGVYARSFGGASGQSLAGGVAVDPSGNAYVVGSAYGQQNLGGGVIGASGKYNLLVAELDPAGNHVWSNTFGQPGGGYLKLALDPGGSVVVAGDASNANLNFGGGTLPPSVVYAAKVTADGSFVWAKGLGKAGSATALVSAAATGPAGEVVLSGDYSNGQVDFGGGPLPSPGSFGATAAYVVKLTNAGAHVFSKSTGTNSSTVVTDGSGVAVNASGEVYLVGGYGGTIDLGGGPVACMGTDDVFFAKLGPNGTLGFLKSYGTAGHQYGLALALDATGTPYLAGTYGPSLDLGNGPLPMESGQAATFLARVAP